ncbi:MAG: phage tail protein [Acutalibacteraceae bacterium]|nr:phage tail protein [Ruminococcus sp.]DAR74028.1 MAG TPA: Major tail protein [Caudoviricetes sp.]
MAISSYKTFLMKKGSSGSTYEKLVDIKEFPDLGGDPNMLDATTLSDPMQINIMGIQKVDALTFTANYSSEDFATLDALKGQELDLAVWFGGTESDGTLTPSGDKGKFNFKGQLSVYVKGAGVDSVVEMAITVAASTKITKASA